MGLKGLRTAISGSDETLELSKGSCIKYPRRPLSGERIGKLLDTHQGVLCSNQKQQTGGVPTVAQ